VSARDKRIDLAARDATRAMEQLGRELRLARLNHDLSQRTAARAARLSQSQWGRIERGAAPHVSNADLARALGVVGLALGLRAFPQGSPLRDRGHVELLERLRRRLGPGARWSTEVPLPNPGDRRAWDALVRIASVRIGVEAETRARDSQELQRRLELKRRDGGVDHVVLLLADTRHDRAFLAAAGPGFREAFPVDGRVALARLALPADPGGSAIILL
jgi:transcriptional regulator with XRE-family HTH domain